MRVRVPPPAPFRWSKNLAYAIGLITTDGNLSKDRRHILFTTTDYQLAKEFKKCLNLRVKIMSTRPSGFGKKIAYRINFGDVGLYRWLETIGLKQNKTYILGALDIPKKFMADFLRGHLDGDGSIFTYKDGYRVYKSKRYVYQRLYTVFNSVSAEHLKWIQTNIQEILNIKGALSSYLPKNRKIRMGKLKYSKNDSLKLLPWLYHKRDLPCLERKRKIAELFLKNPNSN